MTWARLRIVDSAGRADKDGERQRERVFNLNQLQWWCGHGFYCQLQYAGQPPVFVAIEDKRLEMLTGASGGFSSD